MKAITKIFFISLLSGAALLCNSCYDRFDEPADAAPAILVPTHTIKELKALYKGTPLTIEDDIIISGRVISTDESGNIYREMYIQDETSGLLIEVGKTGLYNFYKQGQIIYVRCKGLSLGAYGQMVRLGYEIDPNYGVSYIDVEYLIKRTIFAGSWIPGVYVAPRPVAIGDLAANPDWLCTLVKFENVSFAGTDYPTTYGTIATWAMSAPPDGGDPIYVSQKFTDTSGKTIIVRTSGYSRFADTRIPSANTDIPQNAPVDLTGILSVYNGTYQLTLRTVNDVHVR